MGKSHVVKYRAIMQEKPDHNLVIYQDRIQDIIIYTAGTRKGLNAGDKIKINEQMHPERTTMIVMKKAVMLKRDTIGITSNEDTGIKNTDIQFQNKWIVPRSYYKTINKNCLEQLINL